MVNPKGGFCSHHVINSENLGEIFAYGMFRWILTCYKQFFCDLTIGDLWTLRIIGKSCKSLLK